MCWTLCCEGCAWPTCVACLYELCSINMCIPHPYSPPYSPPLLISLQLLDKANEATDRKLARHLISLYGNGVGRLGNEVRLGWGGRAGGIWERHSLQPLPLLLLSRLPKLLLTKDCSTAVAQPPLLT